MSADASEVAQVMSRFVRGRRAFPDDAAADLRRLLAYDLASRNTARLRLGHLRLVMEMLSACPGPDPFVSSAAYTAERERRMSVGETHPDESTLRSAYGHWLKVIRAASRFMTLGGSARVKHSRRHAKVHQSYEVEGISSALLRCRHDLGDWPTEWKYQEWAALRRMLATEDPRLPIPKVIRKAFGSFDAVLATTVANYQARRGAAEEQGSEHEWD